MRASVLLMAAAALSGCASIYGGVTQATFKGEVCGQPVDLTLSDGKERGSFEISCTTAEGGSATLRIFDSRAFEGQAGANSVASQALGLVDKLTLPVKLVAPGS